MKNIFNKLFSIYKRKANRFLMISICSVFAGISVVWVTISIAVNYQPSESITLQDYYYGRDAGKYGNYGDPQTDKNEMITRKAVAALLGYGFDTADGFIADYSYSLKNDIDCFCNIKYQKEINKKFDFHKCSGASKIFTEKNAEKVCENYKSNKYQIVFQKNAELNFVNYLWVIFWFFFPYLIVFPIKKIRDWYVELDK